MTTVVTRKHHRLTWPGGAILLVVFAPLAAPPAAHGQKARTTVWDGIYTEAQAAPGQRAFSRSCGGCHRDDLRGGDEGEPALRGEQFLSQWNGATVAALYYTVATNMPKSNPGSLPLETCIDIVGFLLKSNGM